MSNQKMNIQRIFQKSIVFGILFFLSHHAFAQKNNVKFSIHAPLTLDFGYERSLNLQHSVLLNFQASIYDNGNGFLFDGERSRINRSKSMNGLYFGQSLGIAQSKAFAREVKLTEVQIVLIALLDSKRYAKGRIELITGSLGLNFGYQKRWKNFNIDTGIAIDYNTPLSNQKGIKLDNGSLAEFPNHIKGFQPSFYVGFGFAL